MKALLRTTVGRRFLAMFLLSALPVAVAVWFGITKATDAVREQTNAVLRSATDGAEAQMREFLSSLKRLTQSLAEDERIRSVLLGRGEDEGWQQMLEGARKRAPEVQEISCLNVAGRVLESSSSRMKGRDEAAAEYFKLGQRSFYPGDITREEESGELQWRMSAPVTDPKSGRVLGVVAVDIDPDSLSELTTGERVLQQGANSQSFRIGDTGETYIVNRHGFLLTESRFAPHAILKVKVETEPVRRALKSGREMFGHYNDYRSEAVRGASAILKESGWVMVTEIDFSQAFAPIAVIHKALLWLGAGLAIIISLIARRFALGIVGPLEMAGAADRALVKGDQTGAMVPEENLPANEIGDFIRKRNRRITELIQRQRALAEEQKARTKAAADLEQLSYSMVHDMRAPLRAIINYGDLMKIEGGDRLSDTQRGYLGRMRAASIRMDHLICDMLRYSSLLRAELPLSAVNAPELVRELVAQNPRFQADAGRIRIEAAVPLVRGNRAALAQCFSALLDNALRYGRPNVTPEVWVRAEELEGWVRLSVEDNGVGMSREFQKRVFGIFQKGIHSADGSGIGLALVRVAVERMGGRVGMTSIEGAGSKFWMDLRPAG